MDHVGKGKITRHNSGKVGRLIDVLSRCEDSVAALGQRGGKKRMEQLNAAERSAPAKHAARSRCHTCEAQAARERAQEVTYLIKQALKDGTH